MKILIADDDQKSRQEITRIIQTEYPGLHKIVEAKI